MDPIDTANYLNATRRPAVQINIKQILYYISLNKETSDKFMVRKLTTVAVLSIASLMSAVQSWKYQGHLLGKYARK